MTNVRYGIAVASAEQNAAYQTKIASYSNPGASLLITAHGSKAYSSSREIFNDNGSILGSNYTTNDGTSFSAPIVSGVIALMLEANPMLGYRDIQEILALTATTKDIADESQWQRNGARNWNGTGMHVSHDYGYGVIDAQAAVRLAQDWHSQQTYDNEIKLEEIFKSGNINQPIADNQGRQWAVNVANLAMLLENVTVKIKLTHSQASDLVIKLISPSGTESLLLNRPGKNPNDDKSVGDVKFNQSSTLDYSFNTALLKGETPNGEWKLQVFDMATGNTGSIQSWSLSFYGKADNGADTYVYTDEFHNAQTNPILEDKNGGSDTINCAAMNGAMNINLTTGQANLAGKILTIKNPQQIENITTGDENDVLVGNQAANVLIGGRGDDSLTGLQGNDVLVGGLGNNQLNGGEGSDTFIIERNAHSQDVIVDFQAGVDKLVLTGFTHLHLTPQQQGKDTLISLGNGQTLRLNNVQSNQIQQKQVVITQETFKPYWLNQSAGYGFANNTNEIALPYVGVSFWGAEGENRLFGGNGKDRLYGGSASDIILGEHDSNSEIGGDDILYGYQGNDRLFGAGGNDILYGGEGDDYLGGGAGNDVFYLEGDDTALASNYRTQQYVNNLSRYQNVEFSWARAEGGKGSDRFVVVKDTNPTASKGLLKNLIWDFDLNDKNEKIDLSQFAGLNMIYFTGFVVNNESYTRVWLGEPNVGTQYITLRGVRPEQLNAEMFIFSKDQAFTPHFAETILGTTKNDHLIGNAISNVLDGKQGSDMMAGDYGDDVYIVDNLGDQVIENKDSGYDIVKSQVNYSLSDHVEELQLIGNSSINGIGNTENNRLVGNAANNRLDGGSGFDTMIGLGGDDTYIVDSNLDKIVEKANEGTDKVIASVSYTLPENVEHLELVGNNALSGTGNNCANQLKGNAGNNRLMSYDGNDQLTGNQGDDFLIGGKGNDVYYFARGDGIDSIYDEQGNDSLKLTNINHNQLWFSRENNDLFIQVLGGQDKIMINDWYQQYQIERIETADHKTLNAQNVDKLVNAMSSFAPLASGQITLPPTLDKQYQPVLAANWV